jgi:ATP/ADP translocase
MMQITTVDEAKTFYPLFGLGANVALIFSGRAVKYFSNVSAPRTLPSLMLTTCPFAMSSPNQHA